MKLNWRRRKIKRYKSQLSANNYITPSTNRIMKSAHSVFNFIQILNTMETEKNNEQTEESTNFQNVSKEYPGYAPDPESGTPNNDSTNCDTTDADSAERLAAKGPIRNPNYHELDDKSHLGNYANKGGSNTQKTLEDFNKTDPNRDINTEDVEDKSRPSGIK